MTPIVIRDLGQQDYRKTWQDMRAFTDQRDAQTPDELWLVEHPPVFTQGQAGKPEHLLTTALGPEASTIPLVQTDRGGQITYHGPGQLVAYPLLNLKRKNLGVRELVTGLEQSVVAFLHKLDIEAAPKPDAPGVYVQGAKVASLGLRVRRGCSFHGISLNIAMDLSPFSQINPCGYAALPMTQVSDLLQAQSLAGNGSTFAGLHNAKSAQTFFAKIKALYVAELLTSLGCTATD